MTNRKRTRVLAQRKADRRAERHQRQRQQRILAFIVVAVIGVLGIAAFLLLRQDDVAARCSDPGLPRVEDRTWQSAPGADPSVTQVTFTTNCGDIVVDTASNQAPETVGSIAFLAEQGFYDGIGCHRLTTAGLYVLQCGDPRGDGQGNPGYTLPDENLPDVGAANYPAGTIAMANRGPGTSGSQFFIVYQDTQLPPGYTIWGTVVAGLDIVEAIASAGTVDGSSDGPPLQQIVIESASITRS